MPFEPRGHERLQAGRPRRVHRARHRQAVQGRDAHRRLQQAERQQARHGQRTENQHRRGGSPRQAFRRAEDGEGYFFGNGRAFRGEAFTAGDDGAPERGARPRLRRTRDRGDGEREDRRRGRGDDAPRGRRPEREGGQSPDACRVRRARPRADDRERDCDQAGQLRPGRGQERAAEHGRRRPARFP